MTILLDLLLYPTLGALIALSIFGFRKMWRMIDDRRPVWAILYGLAAWWLFMIGALGIVALTGLLTGWL